MFTVTVNIKSYHLPFQLPALTKRQNSSTPFIIH